MKQHPISVKSQTRTKQKAVLKKSSRQSRPLHKRFALHPITVLFLLCVGVLLTSITIKPSAASYNIKARLPAPPLTDPAIITNPTDGSQGSTAAIEVSGTCPQASYVNISDNGSFVGTSSCASDNTFQVGISLTPGANQLQAQDYNITDDPGPTSSSITILYTPPVSPPKLSKTPPNNLNPSKRPPSKPTTHITPVVAVPTTLELLGIDYQNPNGLVINGVDPTFTGIAPPNSVITIQIHSKEYSCTTTANDAGYWSCTLFATLSVGLHTVNISAVTPQNKTLSLPPFTIRVVPSSTTVPKKPLSPPLLLGSSYNYSVYNVGQSINFSLHLEGGLEPYAVTVLWGDGKTDIYLSQNSGFLSINHTYGWINAKQMTMVIKIQAIDSSGNVKTLQLIANIRNPGYNPALPNVVPQGTLHRISNDVRHWLWLLWPSYVVVALLVFSFWLGERQEMLEIVGKRRKHHIHHLKH